MNHDLYPVEVTPSVSKQIVDAAKSGEIWKRLAWDDADSCNIRFDKADKYLYDPECFFTITFAETVPRGIHVLILFPETLEQVNTGKVRDVAAINRIIDANLGKNPKHVQAVFCIGDTLYKVSGVTGRLYMHWAATLEYTTSRNPSRWQQTPILASTNRHFASTGLCPVFGQHKRESFVPKGCSKVYTPNGYVVWSLDTAAPVPAVRREALSKATVQDRAQREMIPDHEMDQYQRRPVVATARKHESVATTTTEDDQDRATDDDNTRSEDYSSINVVISELPTPRPFSQTHTSAAVLASGFFNLDADEAPSPVPSHDFAPPRVPEVTPRGDAMDIPMLPIYSAPQDSRARRALVSRTPRLEDSVE